MAKSIQLIILFFVLPIAMLDGNQLTEKLIQIKRLVFPGRQTVLVFHQEEPLSSTEAVLVNFLKGSVDPVIITSGHDAYLKKYSLAMYSVMFIDRLDDAALAVLSSFSKRSIVVEKSCELILY